MRQTIALFVATICSCAAVAQAGTSVKPEQADSIRVDIEGRVRAMAAGAAAGDVEKTFADATTSPDFMMADNGSIYPNRDATLAAFREDFAQLSSQDVKITHQVVVVVSRDVALSTTRGTFSATYKSGRVMREMTFVWTVLWRRESGQWRSVNIHQSFTPLPTQ
jgi:ketosteroid isomerase-like protein